LSPDLSKVLVAIDGSEHSDYALNVAVKIGAKYSSSFTLVQVEVPSAKTETEKVPGNILDERVGIVKMNSLACTQIKVQSSDPAGEILKLANSGNYGLVVLGSRGLGSLKSLLMGSVSAKVAKEAKSSILVVKTKIEAIPKILLGYDGSDQSKNALEFATDLGLKFSAKVDVVSVFNIPVSPEAYIGTEVDRWEKDMKSLLDSAVESMRAKGLQTQGKIIDHNNVPLALTSEAEKGSYDIIVVGSRGQGRLKSLLLGSVASGIANSSKTNVLIVR
jgi:nucleotide-binding universal stress UspA family protein